MVTQNSTNNIVSAGDTLVVTTPGGPPNVETQVALQTDTGFGTWGGAGAYFDDTVWVSSEYYEIRFGLFSMRCN